MNGKAIVLEGHTLGIVMGGEFKYIQILRASVIRGSPYSNMGTCPVDPNKKDSWRFATQEDFNSFNVHSNPNWINQ